MTGKGTHRNPSTPGVQVSFSVYFVFCIPACLRTKVRVLKSSRVVGDRRQGEGFLTGFVSCKARAVLSSASTWTIR